MSDVRALPPPYPTIVNENERAVAVRNAPGPIVVPINNQATRLGNEKSAIPPSFAAAPSANAPQSHAFAVGEQVSQKQNVKSQTKVEKVGGAICIEKVDEVTTEKLRERSIVGMSSEGHMVIIHRTEKEVEKFTVIRRELVLEANNSRPSAIKNEQDEDDAANATCGEKAIEICCQSLVCHFENPFKNADNIVEKKQLMNATRRRGRAKGWTIFKGIVFPLVSDVSRDFWVFFQLLFVLAMLSMSISTFVLAGKNYKIFHVIHLAFSSLAAFLAIIDCIISYTQCSACKACRTCCKKKLGRENSEDFQVFLEDNKGCRKCFLASRSSLDVIRLISTEFIIVLILFCDMFEVATGKGFNSPETYHQIGFALIVYDSIGLIFFVFFIRLVILGRMICNEQRAHPTKEDIENTNTGTEQEMKQPKKNYNIDWSIKKNNKKIQIVFYLHVFGQMLAQVLMLVAVGAKIAYENRNYNRNGNIPESTSYLWYMLIAAYFLPFCGLGTFFIVNNYWVQQFLIGLCIDFVKVLQIGEEDKNSIEEEERASEIICKFVRMKNNQLENEYQAMRKKNICDKFLYPFQSPVLVFICMAYFGAQLAFVICSAFTLNDMSKLDLVFLNGGDYCVGWCIYVFVAGIVGVLINIYSFLVAGIWIFIIGMVIAGIMVLIGCCICLFFCAASDS